MTRDDAVALRIAENIRAALKLYKLRQNRVAKDAGHHPPWLSSVLAGRRHVQIRDLDRLAAALGIPVAELIAPRGSDLKQLSPDEAALLRHVRSWPVSVRAALLRFVVYWTNEAPIDPQSRRMVQMWRDLGQRDRDWLHWVAQELLEKNVAPDLRAAIADSLTREANTSGRSQKDLPPAPTPTRKKQSRRHDATA